MGWYPNGDGRDMSASLDRHITGNYGQDQFKDEAFCKDCAYADDFQDGFATLCLQAQPAVRPGRRGRGLL